MNKQLANLAAIIGLLLLPVFSVAQTFDGGGDGTSWEDALNWDGDVLPSGDANVNASTVTLGSSQGINELDVVGDRTSGTGVLNHSAGSLTGGGWAKIGGNGGGGANDGTYNLSGSAAASGFADTFVGFRGGTGALNLADSASVNVGSIRLAAEGAGSTGAITVSDNASLTAGNINSGGGTGSTATVDQTGGTVTSNNWIALANFGAGGTATYDISGGSVSANDGNFAIGQEGAGTLNVSGSAAVSQSTAATGAILVGGINEGGLVLDGTGDLNITGSAASISGSDLRLGLTGASSGTISWIADAGGVTPIVSADNTEFGPGLTNLLLDLTADSQFSSFGPSGSPLEITLIENANAVSGTFSGLAEGANVSIGGGKTGTISYTGGSGSDVVVNVLVAAIPEPSSLAFFGLASFGFLGRRRRG